MEKHTKCLDSFIKNLYFNDGITQGELAKLLETSQNSLSNRIKRYQTIEPPIFSIKKAGRSRIYHLTEYGKEYYEQKLAKTDLEFNEWEQKKERISNILSNYDTSNYGADETCIALLRKVDIKVIAKTFDINEFKFLALTFGMLGEDMSSRSAFELTIPDKPLNEQWAWGNKVYEKFKNMILNNLDREVIEQQLPTHSIEKDLFFRTYKRKRK